MKDTASIRVPSKDPEKKEQEASAQPEKSSDPAIKDEDLVRVSPLSLRPKALRICSLRPKFL